MDPSAPLFIVNRASGGGSTARRWPRVAESLEASGLAPEAVFTERRGHGRDLADEAIHAGRTTLIAVGGDGTVNEVVNAVLAAGAADDVRVGTIGMGTGKDIAKCLGIGRPPEAIRAIADGAERRLDVGRITSVGETGSEETHFFLLEASAGWVPEISSSVPRWLKQLGDTVPYLLMTGVRMARRMGRDFALSIDEAGFDGRYNTISVHNMEMWGGDLVAAPGALPDDGLLDIIRWGDLGRFAVLRAVIGQRRGGRHLRMRGIDRHPGKLVELDSMTQSAVDLDGEPGGFLPARIRVVSGVLRFLAPPAAESR